MNTIKSKQLFEQAKKSIVGGVNSPVRAFKSVGGHPVFISSARGPYLYDEDNNRYIDLINSWGPMLLGHAHPEVVEFVGSVLADSFSFGAPTKREIEVAELIRELVPSIEKIRMVNSGTEATMAAIRVARGFTQKDKIIKFEGCYHGHADSFLIAAGSGAATFGIPDSQGVTKKTAQDTLTVPYNDTQALEACLVANAHEVAAVILEPVVGNMGCVIPQNGYLQAVRRLCDAHGVLLIFDEVMTGFRLAKGGAQELFGVKPDLTTLGKIIGGGMPVGAYGGRADIMDMVAPLGPVYQAGTLSGNPVAMASGLATLKIIKNNPQIIEKANRNTEQIAEGMRMINTKLGLNYTINRIGSMFTLFFTQKPVNNFEDAKTTDTKLFARYFHEMLNRGVYLAPSQYESLFVSAAVQDADIQHILEAHEDCMALLIETEA
ncbi:MAG: glutamate-1-semialdehyde-2,1-aminomutase [Cytophagales bacterium]|nr:MAG: glutamate-1-semialdehyde-2,1-aminomutase [Cytophagales bacterium]TAF60687.1 MAG: glutamate-1-semialdehyde-2,1-aminomutase [Cytophagales bacterium]